MAQYKYKSHSQIACEKPVHSDIFPFEMKYFVAPGLGKHGSPPVGSDRGTILQDIGVLDPEGNPTARLDVVKKKGDGMIREADHLMAEAIRIAAHLYKADILAEPENYAYAFPDFLTFHDVQTVIEQRLFLMFLNHRMRTFQGTFHGNPDHALWYGFWYG